MSGELDIMMIETSQIKNLDSSLIKLDWADFTKLSPTIAEKLEGKIVDKEKIDITVEFGTSNPVFSDIENSYSIMILYKFNILDNETNEDVFGLISAVMNMKFQLHSSVENKDLINYTELEKSSLANALMNLTWPNLRVLLQNMLDLSDFGKIIKLPSVLIEFQTHE